MKDAIKFLASVANGKINPSLGFIRVMNGKAQAGDSSVFVQMDCDIGLDVTMKADRALAAMNAIKGDPKFKQTEKGIVISGGGTRVTVPTISNDSFPQMDAEGEPEPINGKLIPSLSIAKSFTAENDVRECLNGAYVADGFVRAANGHSGVKLEGIEGIDAILPKRAVEMLCKIGKEPEKVSSGHHSVTFYYEWGWVRCSVIDSKFPNMDQMFETTASPVDCSELKDAVATCKSVVSNSGRVTITPESVIGDDAVNIDLNTGLKESSYNCGLLSDMLNVSSTIAVPDDERKPAVFTGEHGLVGVVMPMIR